MSDIAEELAALMNPDVPPEITKIFPGAHTIPTTDEMDHTTPEERNKLVGFCEHCEEWWNFVKDMTPTAKEAACPKCGTTPSHRIGFQITSQRSFNPILAKKKKLPKKR